MNLFDNFERADNVNGLAGSTLSSGGAIWEKVDGTASAGITGGKAYLTDAFFGTKIVAQSNSNQGDLTVTRTAENVDTRYIFRYIDINNFCYFNLQASATTLNVVVAGTDTSIYSVSASVVGEIYKVIITAAHQITLFKNGTQVHTSTLPAALNTGTKHGFTTFNATHLIHEYSFVDSSVAVNNPPVNTVPATQNAGVNVYKEILGISVNDSNNNLASVKLTATNATINVITSGGAVLSAGAQNSSTLTLSGTQTQINAALANVGYIGTVVGTQTLTVLSTDSTGTPLTDTDVISITVKDAYAVNNTVFDVTGVLSSSVALTPSKQWTLPTGVATWTFTVEKLSAQHTAPIQLNLSGVASTSFNSSLNPATYVFITEAAYPLLTPQQRTNVETTGGGYPLFVVTKNISDTTDAFDVLSSTTKDGTYSTYLIDQLFAPTAIVEGNIDRAHPALSIGNESNMPATITAGTKGLLYDTAGQGEWLELSDLSTKTDGLGTSSIRLLNASKMAIWDSPMPIKVDIDQVGRIALLTSPVVGTTVIADGAQRFFKIIPKVIGGASVNPALVAPIALTITSRSRKPFPVRNVIFSRNHELFAGAFPERDLDQGGTEIYIYPSSRTETVTSGFYSPAAAFETGVTAHVDVKTVGGETLLRTLTATNGTNATYTETMRTADIQRFSTQYEIYTKKNGIESARFIHVVNQRITTPYDNDVTGVATTIVASNIRGAVTLRATAGGVSGTGQETGVYDVVLSGTLFPTVNMDTMTIEGNAATILSYDSTNGRLEVLAPRSLTNFVLIVPFTGTGTISIFAGVLNFVDMYGGVYDIGFTGSATI